MLMRCLALLSLLGCPLAAQSPLPLAELQDDGSLPLHLIYTAPRERSIYLLDQGYRLELRDPSRPLGLVTDTSGSLHFYFKRNTLLVGPVGEYVQPPRMRESYADGAVLSYTPLAGLKVDHRLTVFSSTLLIQELSVHNASAQEQELTILVLYQRDQPLRKAELKGDKDTLFFSHKESWKNWASVELESFEEKLEGMILLDRKADSWGGYKGGAAEFLAEAGEPQLRSQSHKKPTALALSVKLTVPAGESQSLRVIRAAGLRRGMIWTQANRILLTFPFDEIFDQSRQAYSGGEEAARDLIDWQALSLARQMAYPPEGQAGFPYLVDSREPTWGEGHDGQSLYNALALLVLARTDIEAARQAMRLFMSRQRPDGGFPPRVGPFPREYQGKKALRRDSPPLFAWICLGLYKLEEDLGFLEEAYAAGRRYAEHWQRRRGDGLAQWRQPPEGLPYPLDLKLTAAEPGLNALLVGQLKSLSQMASILGRSQEAEAWHTEAEELTRLINQRLWDEERGIYHPLPRKEDQQVQPQVGVSGLLPMWAGVPSPQQARRLRSHLVRGGSFRVPAGVALRPFPSASAQPASNGRKMPDADGERPCCGPHAVSLPLNYLLWQGLRQYGFREEADLLSKDLRDAVQAGLMKRGFFSDTFASSGQDSVARSHVLGSLIFLLGE